MTGKPLRLLIVEDSEPDTELLLRELRRGGYEPVYERVDSAAAMQQALRQRWDLIIADHSVWQLDSLTALGMVKAAGLDSPFIIVSGSISEDLAVQAMKAGASDYVFKGKLARLLPAIARGLAEAEERRARRAAEQALREREQQAALELAAAYEATLDGWARALDLRDRETEGHSRRVTDLTLRLARIMGVSDSECVHIRRGALLHDIGKMAIPDNILHKPAELSPDEWTIMRRHPVYARDLLAPIDYLQPALDIPYCHHEKWDGTGYPRRLRGEDIPLAARMFAAADIWDALRSNRPYRPALPAEEAREHINAIAGTHLDPAVAAAFLDMLASLESASQFPGEVIGAGQSAASRRILVVDDFEMNVALLKRWLEREGYEVLTANSGDSALDAITRQQPDLVLLDIMIPEPSGLVVCQRLKERAATGHIPVIIMSGLPRSVGEASARQCGANGYLSKPFEMYELRARIQEALRRTQAKAI